MPVQLNDLIRAAIGQAEDQDTAAPREVTPKREAVVAAPANVEHEKLAAALDFIGTRGIGSFLKKADAGLGNIGTDNGRPNLTAKASQVTAQNEATPAKGGGAQPTTDENKPAGGGQTQGQTGKIGTGTHHPALASNEAVVNANKTIKSKNETPQIKAVLDATPYADPKPKETFDTATQAGDKNINKSAAVHDPALVKAALAKKIAEAKNAAAAGGR